MWPPHLQVLGWKGACEELARMLNDLQVACGVSSVTGLAQLRSFLLVRLQHDLTPDCQTFA